MPHSLPLTVAVYALIVAASMTILAGAEPCSELADRWPAGPAYGVFVRSGRAYFGSGTVFTVGDLSNPASPVVLAEVNLRMLIHDIVVPVREVVDHEEVARGPAQTRFPALVEAVMIDDQPVDRGIGGQRLEHVRGVGFPVARRRWEANVRGSRAAG